ncbi:hypothetical protein GGR44_001276 [Sphingobium fontiphilum]|uniref:Uncharacterized protein n=1 Tax=Sphingobium fontiphilum TaxID=944425 RepID=A0A7W6DMC0_9SPHN|nr:hypothetical protein [Sphingobium fontiphilum]MBB3981629.1 hypothetical protein [Sphingobium fontiphilum]
MRSVQPEGKKGSLKWIQRAVNSRAASLEAPILDRTGAVFVDWRSPLAEDEFAEYRDAAFLERLGMVSLTAPLQEFWPSHGPQWDALARTDRGDILLVEAKAHIREMYSPASQASPGSLAKIMRALDETAEALGASANRAPWSKHFYQMANRLAHLHFFRSRDVPAWLVLVNFVGDEEMAGPRTQREWAAAYQVMWHVMGLGSRHPLARYIIDICAPIEELQ